MEKNVVAVPDLLADYRTELIAAQREYVKIRAVPVMENSSEDLLGLKESKFLGKPFYTTAKAYPSDKNGKPMVLIAQINFSDVPELEGFPEAGLLQLYFPSDEWYDEGSAEIVYWSEQEMQSEPQLDYSFIKSLNLDELPIWKTHKLDFTKAIDTGRSEDSQFGFMFGDEDYWDFEEKLNDEQRRVFEQYFSSDGHKIGGYADFTQGDPRDYNESQSNDVQLLQIDVDDHIMFGDSGLGHIFINPKDLAEKRFDKAYFYWDCC